VKIYGNSQFTGRLLKTSGWVLVNLKEEIMSEFKVGDIVVGRKSSNQYYHTAKNKGFVGEVISLTSDGMIEVKVLKSETRFIGSCFWVGSRHFKLKKDKFIEIEIDMINRKSKRKSKRKSASGDDLSVIFGVDFACVSISKEGHTIGILYIGKDELTFKEANKVLNVLGYKLVDSSKKKEVKEVEEIKRDQIKYGLAKRTLKEI